MIRRWRARRKMRWAVRTRAVARHSLLLQMALDQLRFKAIRRSVLAVMDREHVIEALSFREP